MREFQCRDVGYDCDWSTRGQNDEQVMNEAFQHGREKHGIREITDDIKNKVRSKIRDVRSSDSSSGGNERQSA